MGLMALPRSWGLWQAVRLPLSHQPAGVLQLSFSRTKKLRLRGEGGIQGRKPNVFRRLSVTKRAFGGGEEDASITNTYRASYVPKHHLKSFTFINLLKPVVYRVVVFLFSAIGPSLFGSSEISL